MVSWVWGRQNHCPYHELVRLVTATIHQGELHAASNYLAQGIGTTVCNNEAWFEAFSLAANYVLTGINDAQVLANFWERAQSSSLYPQSKGLIGSCVKEVEFPVVLPTAAEMTTGSFNRGSEPRTCTGVPLVGVDNFLVTLAHGIVKEGLERTGEFVLLDVGSNLGLFGLEMKRNRHVI